MGLIGAWEKRWDWCDERWDWWDKKGDWYIIIKYINNIPHARIIIPTCTQEPSGISVSQTNISVNKRRHTTLSTVT